MISIVCYIILLEVLNSRGVMNPVYLWKTGVYVFILTNVFVLLFLPLSFNVVSSNLLFILATAATYKFISRFPKVNVREFQKQKIDTDYRSWRVGVIILMILNCIIFPSWQNILLALIVGGAFIRYLKRLEKRQQKARNNLCMIDSDKAPCLFLRSFKTSEIYDGIDNIDNMLFDQYKNRPVIALQNPNDFLPDGTAIKIESSDDQWQDCVIEILTRSHLVIMCFGDTNGLIWELSKIRELLPPERFVLYIPDTRFRNLKLAETEDVGWGDFVNMLETEFKIILPDSMPQQEAVFKFTEDWVAYRWEDSKYATSEYVAKLDEELSEKEGVVDYKALNEIMNGYLPKGEPIDENAIMARIYKSLLYLLVGSIIVLLLRFFVEMYVFK